MNILATIKNSSSKSNYYEATVISNCRLSDDVLEISLDCREIAEKALPGQFISILCDGLTLRRPFSIADIRDNSITILYKLKGAGTEFISNLKSGESVNILGPLGNGFNIENKKSLLIGAGVGVAPLIFLSQILIERKIEYGFLAGFQTSFLSEKYLSIISQCITEDESLGKKGRVTEHIEDIVKKLEPEKIYVCGPNAVMQFAVDIATKYDVDIEVALEKEFACGVGVCMGCNIQVYENDILVNKKVCKDGPVFNGRNVLW